MSSKKKSRAGRMPQRAQARSQQQRTQRPASPAGLPSSTTIETTQPAKTIATPLIHEAKAVAAPTTQRSVAVTTNPKVATPRRTTSPKSIKPAQVSQVTQDSPDVEQMPDMPTLSPSATVASAEAPSVKSASKRRYPTLAQMAAIAPATPSPSDKVAVPDTAATPEAAPVAAVEMTAEVPPMAQMIELFTISETAGEEDTTENTAVTAVVPAATVSPMPAAKVEIKALRKAPEIIVELDEGGSADIADDWDSSQDTGTHVSTDQLVKVEAVTPPERRLPVRTRSLHEEREGATTPVARIASRVASLETDPLLREYPLLRPQPLPETNLVQPIAEIEAGIAAVSAISFAVVMLTRSSGGFWALSMMAIAGLGGWLAYALAHDAKRERSAGAVLLASQLGMLTWLMALLGPRASLLALVPVLLLLSLRTTSRLVAGAGVVVALVVYECMTLLSLNQVLRPALQINSTLAAVLDGIFVVVGMVLLLRAALDIHASRQKAEVLARARLRELRQVRNRAAQLRQEGEDDAIHLQDALVVALYGRDDLPPVLEGPLSPLNETLDLLGERMAMLQRDREERLRLDGALRRLTRAVERAWLGLPWTWPEPSGTVLDDLVALLRTPNPRDASQPVLQDTPALVPIPSDDPSLTPPPWEAPALHPRVREHLSDPAWSFAQRTHQMNSAHNNSSSGNHLRPTRRGTPGASGPASRISPLPWLEWDEWRDWDDRFSS